MSERPADGYARAEVPAQFLDLSLGGALLRIDTTLEVGAIHDFALDLAGETVWVQAEVRRCQPVRHGYEIGVEFLGIDPADRRRLGEYLARQRK